MNEGGRPKKSSPPPPPKPKELSASRNPFDDSAEILADVFDDSFGLLSFANSLNSSSSSVQVSNQNTNIDEGARLLNLTERQGSKAIIESNVPKLPPRPSLPPRPTGSSPLLAGHISASTPPLRANHIDAEGPYRSSSLGYINLVTGVDQMEKKNQGSSLYHAPPPLLSGRTSRKISATSNSIQYKLKEDLIIPDTTRTYKSLPIPDQIPNCDLYHKGSTRGFAISGFNVRIWYSPAGENRASISMGNDSRFFSVNFVSTPPAERVDKYPLCGWAGTEKGEILEFDVSNGEIISRCNSHTTPVTHIVRGAKEMYTIEESGGVRIWRDDGLGKISFNQRPQALRIQSKPLIAILVEGLLWTSQGKFLEIYRLNEDSLSILEARIDTGIGFNIPSNVSAMSWNSNMQEVYVAHESGKISVYYVTTFERHLLVQATSYKITSIIVVVNRIWVGLQTGKILVFESRTEGWVCILDFVAYQNSSVVGLEVDDRALLAGTLNLCVISMSDNGHMRLWDGLLRNYLLDLDIREAAFEYADYTPARVALITYNIDSRKPVDLENDVLESFVGKNDADIFVFGFQELVDLENKGITAKTFLVGSNKTAKALDSTIDERLKLWKERLMRLFPSNYALVHISQLVGLFQCIIARNTINIKAVASSNVKTGLGGLYGNKGGIATRLMIRDSSICFINSHLAAHQNHISDRNKDISQILKDAVFPKISLDYHWEGGGDGSMIMDHEHIFWGGDLNYRIDGTRNGVLEAILSKDWPALWENDQLLKQMKENKSFGLRSFREEPLFFAPTFKYDRGTDRYDSSEKQRIPAYCDRILYRGLRIHQKTYERLEVKMSDHRPVAAVFDIDLMDVNRGKFDRLLSNAQQRLRYSFQEIVASHRREFLLSFFDTAEKINENAPFFAHFSPT